MKSTLYLYRATFWLVVICALALVATVAANISKHGSLSEPWHSIWSYSLLVSPIASLLNVILLAVLISFLNRNPIPWFFGALLLGPLGLIVAYFRVSGLVDDKPHKEKAPSPPPSDLTKLSEYRLSLEVEAAIKAGDAARIQAAQAEVARRA